MINLPIRADDVSRIAAIDDPVLRNLWITQSYADFSARLHDAIDHSDHTWCGFAVWASATAGQSIRRDEVPRAMSDILGASDRHQACIDDINRRLGPLRVLGVVRLLEDVHVLRTFDGALDAVSARIAHGNTLVFGELAPLFVAFLELIERSGASELTPDRLDMALDAATHEPITDGVRRAFHLYSDATINKDPTERAQSVLAANVLALAHEQERLQDDIAAAIDAGLVSAEDVAAELLPRRMPAVLRRLVTGVAGRRMQALLDGLWDDVTTELLMTLRVPGAALRLSHDVPVVAGRPLFPLALATLLDPPAASVFGEWDRTGGTGRDSRARDWVRIDERMNYIVNLFRSRQQDGTLAASPFSPAQVQAMRDGAVPPAPLLPPLRQRA